MRLSGGRNEVVAKSFGALERPYSVGGNIGCELVIANAPRRPLKVIVRRAFGNGPERWRWPSYMTRDGHSRRIEPID